jgi:hypothetical protein
MLRSGLRLGMGIVMFVSCAAVAFAACNAPAQSGLALCFPSVNSTVLYPATIEMAVNSGNVPITHVSVYDGSTKVDDQDFITDTLIDFGMLNGLHHITVNAWDANGKLYQAKSTFTITGFGYGTCAPGSGLINLCQPAAGSYQPDIPTISTAFAAGVTSWSVTLDGSPMINSAQTGQPASNPLITDVSATAGSHTLVVKAVGANGVASTVTRQFSTFYDLNCGPKSAGCTPGILITQPANISEENAADVGTGFRVQAEVMYNTKPTTKMILYMDGVKKEQSAGPGITADVSTSKGSHYLVIQAWDTAGKMYETYGNVNVQ